MNAVIYVRVSSEKQDVELSTSAQLKLLREYARKQGFYIVGEFVDEAETGKNSSRPQFKKMIAMARRNDKPFDTILVYKLSRFARNRLDSIVNKAMLKKKGIQVISLTEKFDNSSHGMLMEAITECFDEFYSNNLGEEVTRGMRESASRGYYLSARPPYGYKKIKTQGWQQRKDQASCYTVPDKSGASHIR